MMILVRMRLTIALAALLSVACAGFSGGAIDVARHDVVLTLSTDGTMAGLETIVATSDSPSTFERTVTTGAFDAIVFQEATLDGAAAKVEVTDGERLRVRWAVPSGKHLLTLRYQIDGVLQLEGRQRRLTFTALPAGRAHDIGAARITLRLPDDVALLAPSGIAEAGWDVVVGANLLEATRAPLEADESATVMALVNGDALPVIEPAWQLTRARAGELAPAFIAGGLFILTVALGIVGMLWWHDRRAVGRTHAYTTWSARQLWVSGLVVILAGFVTAAATYPLARRFGSATHAIPASLVVSGLIFLAVSWRALGKPEVRSQK